MSDEPTVVQTYYHGFVVQPDCAKCPLRYDTKVQPDGYYPARLCLVGENPGEAEQREGRGFVGRSGNLLWQFCKAYGFTREDVWLSNAAACRKRKVRLATGAELSEAQVAVISAKACRRRLIGELFAVTGGNPNAVIVPLGNIARQMLSSRRGGGVWAYRGSIETIDLQALWNKVNS
jgi:DNA polymerase